MRIRSAIFLSIAISALPVRAQNIVGFPREDFGKIVLSQKQLGGELEARIGNYNNEPISKYGRRSLFARLGRSIGRIDIQTDKGVFPCTGFLISDSYVLTNFHCVPGVLDDPRVKAIRIEAAQIVMGYIRDGIEKGVRRYSVSIRPIEYDKSLDYSILEVNGNPGRRFGKLALTNEQPVDSAPYWIIGHPMGEAQRISREDCQSDTPAVAGGRLRHRCDTLPGNSGSPVIDPGSLAAIALHHAGSSRNSINYAIPIARIAQHSKIVAKLLAAGADQSVDESRKTANFRGSTSELDGNWIGEWCSLKTPERHEKCGHLVFEIKGDKVAARRGIKGQPGFAAFNGKVSDSGVVTLNVRGIHRKGRRRGQPYEGSLTGRAVDNTIDAAGYYSRGRGMTLKLRRDRAAFAAKAALPAPSRAMATRDPSPSSQYPFDGVWQVLVERASTCPHPSWKFNIVVLNGNVSGGRRLKPSYIKRDGTFRIVHTGKRAQHIIFRYDGKVFGDSGTGKFQVLGRGCHGFAKLNRIPNSPVVESQRASVSSDRSQSMEKFHGFWHIVRIGAGCRKQRIEFAIRVDAAQVKGALRRGTKISGHISRQGQISFSHPTARRAEGPGLRYTGTLEGDKGSGSFAAERGRCSGTFVARRL